ncbi:hypothetical protein DEU56DRAFT_754857 [Suillus clintonianus]|uniref:uncharacterized protein n=1 Tax=Suillus clintonianus TaxID=1904413 RepID=UPI001B85E108|nr:uncharacterized protein DEU56DRAFT_754857 [Suillus clintonianus]KAG2141890.1 hypothetical protein DEU56DRAFT_754857 [Suillus clintonianus]
MQTADSKLNVSESVSGIIGALQNILAQSQVIIPDLETTYSKFPNTDHSAVDLGGQSVIDIIAERQQQLDGVVHDIMGLESVVDSIKNLHQQLVEKKVKITQSMNLHKGLVSALWRFPTEVLSQIFHQCLPETKMLLPSMLKAPILLTGICRRWREVAVGMPSLWCSLRLYVEVDDRHWHRAAFCYDMWLKRSRGHPLSLAIGCNHSTKLRSLLQPYVTHIKSLQVSIRSFQGGCPALFSTDLPALQELTILGMRHPDTPAIAQSISRLSSTLRSLKVIDMKPFFDLEDLSYFSPVWAHLTDVQIALSHPNAVIHLLQLCPNLSSLTLRIACEQIEPLNLESFAHAKIQSLRIVYDSLLTRHLSGLLNALLLPNLRVLEARRSAPWPHEDLKAFLARSECPLETLIFGGRVTMTDVQRAEYVALIPFLKVVVDHGSKYI